MLQVFQEVKVLKVVSHVGILQWVMQHTVTLYHIVLRDLLVSDNHLAEYSRARRCQVKPVMKHALFKIKKLFVLMWNGIYFLLEELFLVLLAVWLWFSPPSKKKRKWR